MAKEVEIKFLDVDHASMRTKLKGLGAKLKSPKQLYRRINLDFKNGNLKKIGGWVRLRDEGDKITLTHKMHRKNSSGELEVSEFEIIVNDFAGAEEFLKSIGMEVKTYQENYRENWQLKLETGTVEIALDQWPHVKPHVELELESGEIEALKQACKMLGLEFESGINDDICPIYITEYEILNRDEIYNLEGGFRFDTPFKFKRKN